MIYPQLLIDSIFQNIPAFLFWKNVDSVYLGCNERYANLLGLQPADIVGKTDYEIGWLAGGDGADKFREGDQATLAGHYTKNEEEWLAVKNGMKILTLVNKVPLRDDTGQIIGVLGMATDITETKKLQQHLAKVQYQIKGMTILSAAVSHELRTPLAALKDSGLGIEQALPLLCETYEIAQQHHLPIPFISSQKMQLLSSVVTRLVKMADQCNAILNMLLTNINTQKQDKPLPLKTCSAAGCINEALSRYAFPRAFSPENIIWKDKNQPQNDFTFQGQFLSLIHVLFNLLKNALYFIHKAGKGEVEIWLEKSNSFNAIHFKDTATGIKSEVLPHIFECFYTANTNKGSGIGLAFCEITLQQFGGSIECHSEYGKFTEFILKFPKP